jgi:hypothetical protein
MLQLLTVRFICIIYGIVPAVVSQLTVTNAAIRYAAMSLGMI